MLTPEAAREQLKKHQSDKFVQERLARLTGFPETVRADARACFSLRKGPAGRSYLATAPGTPKQGTCRLPCDARRDPAGTDSLSCPNSRRYPPGPWHAERHPYTSGHTRKPFRAPSLPALLDEVRMTFLSSLVAELRQYPPDIEWIATWAAHAWPYRGAFVAPLLAAAIDENDAKGQKVFEILSPRQRASTRSVKWAVT